MGWSYTFWKDNFYPADLKSHDFLSYYSKQFDTVEVDSTFYRIPQTQTVVEWKKQTTEEFTFALKFPQIITHVKMLKDCQDETNAFIERVDQLQEKLGPLLLQLPPTFKLEQLPTLDEFLSKLPKKQRYAVEIRNKSLLVPHFFSILRKNKVAHAWIESPKMPFTNEMTTNFAYARLEGDRKTVSGIIGRIEIDRSATTKMWTERIRGLVDEGIDVFLYFSKYYSGHPPSDAREFLRITESWATRENGERNGTSESEESSISQIQ